MPKSDLAKFVRSWTVQAKAHGHTCRVYGLDPYSARSYGFVSKEGNFWPADNDPQARSNAYVLRKIRNTIGTQPTLEGRRGLLRALDHFKKEA